MEYGELWRMCERFVLKNNLRKRSCDALRKWVWGSEEWGYVVEEGGLLCLCAAAEHGNEVVRQVGTGGCVVA